MPQLAVTDGEAAPAERREHLPVEILEPPLAAPLSAQLGGPTPERDGRRHRHSSRELLPDARTRTLPGGGHRGLAFVAGDRRRAAVENGHAPSVVACVAVGVVAFVIVYAIG
jgi:hypothetical protein